MAKYEVKDINKNGKIDDWEQAKYDAINKATDSPAKFVGGALAGAAGVFAGRRKSGGIRARLKSLEQRLGALEGNDAVSQPMSQAPEEQMMAEPRPMPNNPNALGQLGGILTRIVGDEIPGTYDREI